MTEKNWAAVNERAVELGCASWRELLRRIATGEIIAATRPAGQPTAATEFTNSDFPAATLPAPAAIDYHRAEQKRQLSEASFQQSLVDRSRAKPIAGGGMKS